jgi:hypothetical protein
MRMNKNKHRDFPSTDLYPGIYKSSQYTQIIINPLSKFLRFPASVPVTAIAKFLKTYPYPHYQICIKIYGIT